MTPDAKRMDMLRRDALARGMLDLAAVYGWAEIRINNETLRKQALQWVAYKAAADRSRDPGQ